MAAVDPDELPKKKITHELGQELALLSVGELAERVGLLKQNIRRYTRDIFHYESIEVRLLDRRTGRLQLLLQDGMLPASA